MAKCTGLGRGLGGCVGESSWEVFPYVSLVPERGEGRCDGCCDVIGEGRI